MRSLSMPLLAATVLAVAAWLGWVARTPDSRDPPSGGFREILADLESIDSTGDSAEESFDLVSARLEPLLSDLRAPADRFAVASALGGIHSRIDDLTVRADVLRLLEKLGGAEGAEQLARIVRSDRTEAAAALSRISRLSDPDSVEALVRIIEEEARRGELAISALRALGRSHDRRWARFVEELTAEELEWGLRREAVEALGKFADRASLDVLESLLSDPHARVRQAAIRAVGSIPSSRSRELLERLWADASLRGGERELVRAGLETLRGKRARTGPAR